MAISNETSLVGVLYISDYKSVSSKGDTDLKLASRLPRLLR